jgi:hypothetical protein
MRIASDKWSKWKWFNVAVTVSLLSVRTSFMSIIYNVYHEPVASTSDMSDLVSTKGSRLQTRPRAMDFKGYKISSTPSFGDEIKPSATYKILRHVNNHCRV